MVYFWNLVKLITLTHQGKLEPGCTNNGELPAGWWIVNSVGGTINFPNLFPRDIKDRQKIKPVGSCHFSVYVAMKHLKYLQCD